MRMAGVPVILPSRHTAPPGQAPRSLSGTLKTGTFTMKAKIPALINFYYPYSILPDQPILAERVINAVLRD